MRYILVVTCMAISKLLWPSYSMIITSTLLSLYIREVEIFYIPFILERKLRNRKEGEEREGLKGVEIQLQLELELEKWCRALFYIES